MNFKNLQYFLAVAEELNITKAAEKMYVSQQALSNHIAKLEDELNAQLFARAPRLSLTLAGRCLKKASLQICDIYSQLLQEIKDINDDRRGELRIGISFTRGQAILPRLIPAFHQMHPLVEIELVERPPSMLEEDLIHGTIDLMFGFAPILIERAVITEIGTERFFLVVPHEIMKRRYGETAEEMCDRFSNGVVISEFANEPFVLQSKAGGRIRSIVNSLFRQYGIDPNVLLETRNIQTAFALVKAGMGLTIYPECYLANRIPPSAFGADGERLDYFPLLGEGMSQTMVIAYSRERYFSKASADFIRIAKNCTGILQNDDLS